MKVYFIYEQDCCFGTTERKAFRTYERAKLEFQALIGARFITYAADKELTLNREEMLFYDAEGSDLIEMPSTAEDFEVHGNEVYCQIDKNLSIAIVGLEMED